MDVQTLYWLAGLLEGEGSFMRGTPSCPNLPVIALQMTDEDIVAKVSQIFGVKYSKDKPSKRHVENPHWKRVYSVRIKGQRAVDIMQEIFPLMGIRRQKQMQNAIESHQIKQKRFREGEIEQILALCQQSNMTQGQIAKDFGIRRETVNRIARGKYKPLMG